MEMSAAEKERNNTHIVAEAHRRQQKENTATDPPASLENILQMLIIQQFALKTL